MVAFVVMALDCSQCLAQYRPMVPVTPRPGSPAQFASQQIGQQSVSGNSVTQGNSAWQPVPGAAQYRVAALAQPQPGVNQQRTGYEGFYVNPPPGYGTINASYNAPVYQVAQLPQQVVPLQAPQYQQPPPVYVPQNLAAPPMQSYPGYGVNYGNQFGFNAYQPLWTAQINYLYMTRVKSKSLPLLVNGGGGTVVNADQLDFGWKGGFDVGLSRRLGPYSNFELGYFQIDSWTATLDSPFAAGDSITTTPLTPLFVPGSVNYIYDSVLRSFEANWVNRTSLSGSPRFSIGFRYLSITENLAQTFMSVIPSTAIYNIATKNRLYGLQFATDGTLTRGGPFALNTWLKGGIYANVGRQNSAVDTLGLTNGIDRTTAAFVGETGIVADYQLLPNVSLIAGYQILYVSGVALAADQQPNMSSFATGIVPSVLDQSDVVYHGALIGIDLHW